MDKKALNEAEIRTKFITPAIVGEGGSKWNVMTQVLEERFFTKGRVIVRGSATAGGEAKRADYILFYKPNIPLAVVEAKDNNHSVGAGMQQALIYAEILDVPFAYSSNGDAFLEHDRTVTSGKEPARSRSTGSPRQNSGIARAPPGRQSSPPIQRAKRSSPSRSNRATLRYRVAQ